MPIEILKNIAYEKENPSSTLDIYLPEPKEGIKLRPLIIWLHGGQLVCGDKADSGCIEICNGAAEEGYVCASINYSLAENYTNRWDICDKSVLDCKKAIAFLVSFSQKLSIDPKRVGVLGNDSGGVLALLSAFSNNEKKLTPEKYNIELQAVANIFGGSDKRYDAPGGIPSNQKQNRLFSPETYIRKNLPATFICHGSHDSIIPASQAYILDDLLRLEQVPHDILIIEKGNHDLPKSAYWDRLLAFLDKHLKPPVKEIDDKPSDK
jgi:acetyl esterase/lipase